MSQSDLTFFTNETGATLLDNFKTTLTDTRFFDVLVGFFRSSGFFHLYESIEPIEKTRILIGLGLDNESYQIIDSFQNQSVLDFESHSNTKRAFQDHLVQDVENAQEREMKFAQEQFEYLWSQSVDVS